MGVRDRGATGATGDRNELTFVFFFSGFGSGRQEHLCEFDRRGGI
jgi:hypothetical protein